MKVVWVSGLGGGIRWGGGDVMEEQCKLGCGGGKAGRGGVCLTV